MEVIRLSQSEQSKSPVELEGKVRKPIATTYSVNYLPLTQTEQRSLTKIKEKTSQVLMFIEYINNGINRLPRISTGEDN